MTSTTPIYTKLPDRYRKTIEKLKFIRKLKKFIYPFKFDKIKHRMPEGWVLRIYHDNSIDPKAICRVECLKVRQSGEDYDEFKSKKKKKYTAETYLDNVDFCNIE